MLCFIFTDMNNYAAIILLCFLLCVCVVPNFSNEIIKATKSVSGCGDDHSYRLPTSFNPEHYKVKVLTHLGDSDGFKFSGRVWIKMLCNNDTNNITLHSKNLDINVTDIVLSSIKNDDDDDAVDDDTQTRKFLSIDNVEFDGLHDFMIINVKEKLTKGHRYLLNIPFEAELTQGLLGYYRSSYIDRKTQTKQ